jgi:branched-chain amino acid transport system permease protein
MFWQQIVNGLTLGSIYTLVALGYALIMGYLGVLNVAVSEIFMATAFVGWTLLSRGLPLVAAFVGALLAAAAGSVVVELVGYRPFLRKDVLVPLLSTISLSIVIDSVVINLWGTTPLQFPPLPGLARTFRLGHVQVSALQVLMFATTVVLCALLSLLVHRTQVGRAIRAVAENLDGAQLLGIPVARVTLLTFALSGLLAGAAGVLVGLSYSAINPEIGQDVGLQAIAVMVMGGIDNAWGSIVAGPLIGIAEALTAGYLNASYTGFVIYGLFILVLLFRPEGILARRSGRVRF